MAKFAFWAFSEVRARVRMVAPWIREKIDPPPEKRVRKE
jgi:hypothetical protein